MYLIGTLERLAEHATAHGRRTGLCFGKGNLRNRGRPAEI